MLRAILWIIWNWRAVREASRDMELEEEGL